MTQIDPGVAAMLRGAFPTSIVAARRLGGASRHTRGSAASPSTQSAPSPAVMSQRHHRVVPDVGGSVIGIGTAWPTFSRPVETSIGFTSEQLDAQSPIASSAVRLQANTATPSPRMPFVSYGTTTPSKISLPSRAT